MINGKLKIISQQLTKSILNLLDRKKATKVQNAQQEIKRVRNKGERENIAPLILKETEIVKEMCYLLENAINARV